MGDIQYFTPEGLETLKKELNDLKHIERPKIVQAIAEARDKGDLSVNAEYDAAKEAQGHLEDKIALMEHTLANARVIDASQLNTDKASILCKVQVKNHNTGKEAVYRLVSEKEANLKENKISVLLASHNMDEVKRLCNSVLMMKGGIIVDRGSPDHLIKKHGRKNLEEVFLELVRNQNEFN